MWQASNEDLVAFSSKKLQRRNCLWPLNLPIMPSFTWNGTRRSETKLDSHPALATAAAAHEELQVHGLLNTNDILQKDGHGYRASGPAPSTSNLFEGILQRCHCLR